MRKLSIHSRNSFFLSGLFALAIAGCSKPAVTEETVFTVNGEAVPMKEYYSTLERKPVVEVMTPQGPQDAQVTGMLGIQALRDLINKKLIFQLAKEDGVMPTEADVKAELDRREKENPKLVSNLTAEGYTLEEIKSTILFDLARINLLTKGVTVPMTEVEQYIKDNPQMFMEPERAKLLMIVLNDATKRPLVDKDLQSGQDFQTVAVRYSEAPQARQTGGAYNVEIVPQMPQPVQEIVKKTPVKKASDWIQAGGPWVKFYVQSKTPAKKMDMTEDRKLELKRQMALQRGSRANDLQKRVNEKLRAAKIDVVPKQLREPWNKLFEQAKNEYAQQEAAARANSAPTSPAPTAGGTGATPGAAPKSGK